MLNFENNLLNLLTDWLAHF